ncbi:MAG TPA: peptidylprolyl isomerase [Caulobacteraceae bacterium]|jgi:peptidyl-prolyl cis-trans isomerase A (cyclophilin A)
MAEFTKRTLLAGLGVFGASRVLAQTPTARPKVILTTGDGPITLELANDKAPLTCANFLRYVDAKRLDKTRFYRAMKVAPDPLNGLIQGGVGGMAVELFPPVAHESTTQTGLHHVDGTISLAREAPGSATCDFFICVGPVPSLDADPTQPGDNLGFAAFGQVTDGMDVVRKILLSPTSSTEGEGVMKGQMLDPTIPIVTVRRA